MSLQSIYRLKKVCWSDVEDRTPLLTPEEVVDRIFQLVDENGDGEWWMAQAAFLPAESSPELGWLPAMCLPRDHLALLSDSQWTR